MKRIIVGITGASGVIYGVRLLQVLRALPGLETHLILSRDARDTLSRETEWSVAAVEALAHVCHPPENLAAPPASGSFLTDGMAVVPCSMKTLSAIAHSYNADLLVRAADVTLKERRRLVLVPRETPLHRGHLRLLRETADLGAVILPPLVAFYHQPRSVAEVIDQTVGKVLDQLEVEHDLFRRWTGR
ncbi:MAG TPA: UbiX family flavin prenyltransferase [Deferrisomatales bacterium]|nr:UbiX family flavin prenyltransferase [Deferrisomatales bacterium]